ncbi:hypothetical protein HELRODRAFT_111011 [Helobdella robusta]|uniref:Uncharacterized protein n=1 Tax=Helobdella robusta TaxID=6412 RepID=T1EF70_HELRO|nr:hypothetical protein HELRODRAFT_111011 [Helobdella robusta]ESO07005.1 hypothetical protein HELRODRAFT_111011 [Helobdella robusta]
MILNSPPVSITVRFLTGLLAIICVLYFITSLHQVQSNPDARRLYDDLLRKSKYNRLIRPALNNTSSLLILISLKLSQIIDVDEKNEIITTNVWLNQEWTDYSLVWDPVEYGGVNMLYVPAESIWIPDIVLYNNADGDYIITLMTKVTISFNGSVKWEPPAIYKSQCEIDVQYFPFDEQKCKMKFGSWTYSGALIDVRHKWNKGGEFDMIDPAIQLNEFYKSVEWDLMNVTAQKKSVFYPCCGTEPYPDVTFTIVIRRKTLYLIINLIIPCVSINMLTFLAFYLPCDCGEKVSVCISIMLSLSIFQLLLMDLVPGTSIVIPMIGKYLLLTCILVSLSAILSVIVLNLNHRSLGNITIPKWVKKIFIDGLPRFFFIRRPPEKPFDLETNIDFSSAHSELVPFGNPYRMESKTSYANLDNLRDLYGTKDDQTKTANQSTICEACARWKMQKFPPNVHKAIEGLAFVANHVKSADTSRRVKDDWKYVSRVFDRIVLFLYLLICFVGGISILMNAPTLYDGREAMPDGI